MRGGAAGLGEWAPWLFVAGAASYLLLPDEPGIAAWAVCAAVAAGLGLAAWRSGHAVWLAAAVLAIALLGGAGWTALFAHRVAAPVLTAELRHVALEGEVETLELRRNGSRAVLRRAGFDGGGPPMRVRLTIPARFDAPSPGMRISLAATLSPPPRPVWPGGFDTARRDWFHGVGAVGYAVGPWREIAPRPAPDWAERLQSWRWRVARRILDGAGGDPARTVAAALIVGDKGAIPEALAEDYRASGLAHMLAISGLHMSLLAGLAFLTVRRGLAMVPAVALRFPIKKWAAVAALILTAAYLLLSGASVPTQRAFAMTAIALLAVLLDRSPFSFRLLGVAAVAVAARDPEAVLGPSFQMSFAAVLALIAVYRLPRPWILPERGSWLRRPVVYLGGVLLTTVVATCATAPFALYHFGRIAVHALPANLLALPVLGFWVMPWGLLSAMAMPFGAEAFPLARMAEGIAWINAVAHWVASWPGHRLVAPQMPGAGLALCVAGGLWLCLGEGFRRLAGLAALAAGLSSPWWTPPPDLLVADRGRAVAIRRGEDYGFLGEGRQDFLASVWEARTGGAMRPGEGWRCDAAGCVGESPAGWRAARSDRRDALEEDCVRTAVVLARHPLPPEIRAACAASVLDADDLARAGVTLLWLDAAGRVIRRVGGNTGGRRPWRGQ